jgi:hypothetical protein
MFPSLRSGVFRNVAATLGEPAQHEAEERMTVDALGECARALDDVTIEEREQRPERRVLRDCEHDCEAALLDVRAPADDVESQPEEGAVQRMHCESADQPDVGVVRPEDATVERLLQSPNRRGDGSRCCGTQSRRHTL